MSKDPRKHKKRSHSYKANHNNERLFRAKPNRFLRFLFKKNSCFSSQRGFYKRF